MPPKLPPPASQLARPLSRLRSRLGLVGAEVGEGEGPRAEDRVHVARGVEGAGRDGRAGLLRQLVQPVLRELSALSRAALTDFSGSGDM